MIRTTVINAIKTFLASRYDGPVAIHPETSEEAMDPPYAVVQVGSGEQMFPDDSEIWDMNVMIGVFHDADATDSDTAETQSAELFAMFDDPEPFKSDSSGSLAWTIFERTSTEMAVAESRWQHVAAFRAIVAPQ